MTAPSEAAHTAAAVLAHRTGVAQHDVAVVLGSGWGEALSLLGRPVASIPAADLPGFRPPGVEGHSPHIESLVTSTGRRILVLGARHHFYEYRDVAAVAHPVRVAAASGCTTVVLTNAAGSTRPEVKPGTPVVISDHINLTGATPLAGARFVDMSEVYSRRLRELALDVDPGLSEGVYAQFSGPQYETPAEVRMAAGMGADLVGMSTALEAIAARAEGLEILGLSLVTNLAAGIGSSSLSHSEVLAAGRDAASRLATLLSGVVAKL